MYEQNYCIDNEIWALVYNTHRKCFIQVLLKNEFITINQPGNRIEINLFLTHVIWIHHILSAIDLFLRQLNESIIFI